MSYIRELGHWKGALPFSVAPKNTSIWELFSELCQCDRSILSHNFTSGKTSLSHISQTTTRIEKHFFY